jgi:hypothetical protein|tara:strand:- start:1674 stop:1886 length:213 start_codon:yes stop_codon:yes gene_type:complete
MDLHISNSTTHIELERKRLIKMNFIYNAIQDGWSVKKQQDTFIFSKKHEGKKQIFQPEYLEQFIEKNMIL